MNYSILMSVYYKEKPQYLRESIESMLAQSVRSNDFVIVCDGPLTDELYEILNFYESDKDNCINRIQLDKNCGLGIALNIGLEKCKNEFVARMDSDDLSMTTRCEKELKLFEKNKDLCIVSSTILEFIGDTNNVIGKREVPETNEEIIKFAKKRNPFNHPSVMMKKSKILEVGGYREKFHLFEDYDLWVRILMNGNMSMNIKEPLLFMRITNDVYRRRGGIKYANELRRFNKYLIRVNWINMVDYIIGVVPHYLVCILPNIVRKVIYMNLVRRKNI